MKKILDKIWDKLSWFILDHPKITTVIFVGVMMLIFSKFFVWYTRTVWESDLPLWVKALLR